MRGMYVWYCLYDRYDRYGMYGQSSYGMVCAVSLECMVGTVYVKHM